MNLIWLTSFAASVILFASRGLILAIFLKRFLAWTNPGPRCSISFLAILITIAIVSAFPPLHRSGHWIDETTGSPPTPVMTYYLDKRWFGLFVFYQFPGKGPVDNSVNAHFGPYPGSPKFRLTQAAGAIDFPVLVVEVLLLTAYTLRLALSGNKSRLNARPNFDRTLTSPGSSSRFSKISEQ